jgi:hypothetical protein
MKAGYDSISSKRSSAAAPKETKAATRNAPGRIVGWISAAHSVAWVVSPHRQDRRTGAVGRATWGAYAQELYAAVSLGIALPKSLPQPPALSVTKEKAPELPKPATYVLAYTARGRGDGRGRVFQFPAESDSDARIIANAYLEGKQVPTEMRKQAALYEGEREVGLDEQTETPWN